MNKLLSSVVIVFLQLSALAAAEAADSFGLLLAQQAEDVYRVKGMAGLEKLASEDVGASNQIFWASRVRSDSIPSLQFLAFFVVTRRSDIHTGYAAASVIESQSSIFSNSSEDFIQYCVDSSSLEKANEWLCGFIESQVRPPVDSATYSILLSFLDQDECFAAARTIDRYKAEPVRYALLLEKAMESPLADTVEGGQFIENAIAELRVVRGIPRMVYLFHANDSNDLMSEALVAAILESDDMKNDFQTLISHRRHLWANLQAEVLDGLSGDSDKRYQFERLLEEDGKPLGSEKAPR